MTEVYVQAAMAVDALRDLPDASVDFVVTDPPYGLSDHPDINAVLTAWENGHDYLPTGGGFMNSAWDAFVPGPAVWTEVARVLRPAGIAAVFTGSRTADLTGHALTLGGLEVHHTWHWANGSGFPKSLDVGKALGKARDGGAGPTMTQTSRWQGWGTALKPAHEPAWIATRPDHPGLNMAGVPVGYAAKANSSERVVVWLPDCDCFPDPHRLPGPAEVAWTATVCAGCGQAYRAYQHPTVKPVAVMTRLLSYLGMESGMTVLDPFAGTGTTAVAAINAHAGAVVTVDADPVHAAVTRRRVDAATAAPTLLPPSLPS